MLPSHFILLSFPPDKKVSMLQAYLLAMFSNMVVKMLSDLQTDLFGPESAAETFRKLEIEPEISAEAKPANGVTEEEEKVPEKAKKRSKMLDLLRRKKRKPTTGRRRPFENGQSDPESEPGELLVVHFSTDLSLDKF